MLWHNPEWVRHARALLRPARVLNVVIVTLALCGVTFFGSLHSSGTQFYTSYFNILVVVQFLGLGMWCLYSCGQAIAQERVFQTFDFWRTTRLTPQELIVGKVCGVPLIGYLAVACTLPVGLFTGLKAGIDLFDLLLIDVLLITCSLFISLVTLLISMLSEKLRAGFGLSMAILALPVITTGFLNGPFPGLAALNPYYALSDILGWSASPSSAVLFGQPVNRFFITHLLYLAIGVWVFLMLYRNIKRDFLEIRLLSRWQTIGFGVFWNVLLYALFDADSKAASGGGYSILVLNCVLVYAAGIISITPQERLRAWWQERSRGHANLFAEDSLPWPWPLVMAAGAVMLYGGMAIVSTQTGLNSRMTVEDFGTQLGVVTVFAVRDTLFLQWCSLQRFRRPLLAGLLYLGLYYVIVQLIAGPFQGLFTLIPGIHGGSPALGGVLVQGAVIVLLLALIRQRLKEPSRVIAPSAVAV